MAKLIVIEGADKVGKETQSKLLQSVLHDSAFPYDSPATLVEVPTKGLTHRLIYWMLRNGSAKRFPHLFQLTQTLNKLAFQLFNLPKLMKDNHYVVLDRWGLSAIVYGDATGVNKWFNRVLFSLLKKPDVTLIMHGQSFRRSSTVDDSYEKDNELQARVKEHYHDIGTCWPGYVLIDNGGTREEVHMRIMDVLKNGEIVT